MGSVVLLPFSPAICQDNPCQNSVGLLSSGKIPSHHNALTTLLSFLTSHKLASLEYSYVSAPKIRVSEWLPNLHQSNGDFSSGMVGQCTVPLMAAGRAHTEQPQKSKSHFAVRTALRRICSPPAMGQF